MPKRPDDDDIPDVIPQVVLGKDGEPMIAREIVVRPSPVPRSMSIIMMILVALSIGYTVMEQQSRNNAQQKQSEKDAAIFQQLTEAQAGLAEAQAGLQGQQVQADKERARLRALILALLASKSPGESRRLLEAFVAAEAKDQGAKPKPSSRPSPRPSQSAHGPPKPGPSPQPHPSPSHSPSPSPSHLPLPIPIPTILCPPVCADIDSHEERDTWTSHHYSQPSR